MEALQIINFIQDIGFVGLLIVLAVPRLRQAIFGLNGYDRMRKEMQEIHKLMRNEHRTLNDTLTKHMADEAIEMKGVHDTISNIQADVSYIKGKLDSYG